MLLHHMVPSSITQIETPLCLVHNPTDHKIVLAMVHLSDIKIWLLNRRILIYHIVNGFGRGVMVIMVVVADTITSSTI